MKSLSFTIWASWVLGLSSLRLCAVGSSNLHEFGAPMSGSITNIEFSISTKVFEQLPRNVKTFSLQSPSPFPQVGILWVVNTAALTPDDQDQVRQQIVENPTFSERGQSSLLRGKDKRFIVDSDSGVIVFRAPDISADEMKEIQRLPAEIRDNNLSLDEFAKKMREWTTVLQFDSSEIERKPNGDYFTQVMDNNSFPNHGSVPLLYQRSVTYFRTIGGHPLITTSFQEIKLTRCADGKWRELFACWPKLKKGGEVNVNYRSNDDLKHAFRAGRMLWDYTNATASYGAKRIAVTDIRLAYYQPRDSEQLVPALLLDAKLGRNSDANDAVLILPLQ